MRVDDLFVDDTGQAGPPSRYARLRLDLLESLRRAPQPGIDDVEAAVALARLCHDNFISYGTDDRQKVIELDISAAVSTLKAILGRLGIDHQIEWRDYSSFRSHWLRVGARGSWEARRQLLRGVFQPVHDQLEEMEDKLLGGTLAETVGADTKTGWPNVDEEVRELRRRFRTATSPQDYRAVGTHCVGVLEALSRTVYRSDLHLREGEEEPSVDKTKQRIGRFIEDNAAGPDNAGIRSIAVKSVELAHSVKHQQTPSQRDAGIAADSVILLANILRRLAN